MAGAATVGCSVGSHPATLKVEGAGKVSRGGGSLYCMVLASKLGWYCCSGLVWQAGVVYKGVLVPYTSLV